MMPDGYSALLRERQRLVDQLTTIAELRRLELDTVTTIKEQEEVEALIVELDGEIARYEVQWRREREDAHWHVYWDRYNSMTIRLSGLAVVIALVAFILAFAYGWASVPMSLAGMGMSLYTSPWRTRRYRKAVIKRIQELLEAQIC